MAKNLTVLYDFTDKSTFQSTQWNKGYNPALAFVTSENAGKGPQKGGPNSLGQSMTIEAAVHPRKTKHLLRFSFRKTDWEDFIFELGESICNIILTHGHYREFVSLVQKTAQKHIHSGCQTPYVLGLLEQTSHQYKR